MLRSTLVLAVLPVLLAAQHSATPKPATYGARRSGVVLEGKVAQGQGFSQTFAGNLVFELRPHEVGGASVRWDGWELAIHREGESTNLAEVTEPLHGPNNLTFVGWYFLPKTNAPKSPRTIFFSPEVGRTITTEMMLRDIEMPSPNFDHIHQMRARVQSWGKGMVRVQRFKLVDDTDPTRPRLVEMEFVATMSWPSDYSGR